MTQANAKAFDRDRRGHPIPGGTSIVSILNESITDSTWKEIKIPAGINCKQMLITERSQGIFKVALVVGGTPYFSVSAPIGMEMRGQDEQTLFFAQMVSGSGTLEILFVR